jgi:hypothetical protein
MAQAIPTAVAHPSKLSENDPGLTMRRAGVEPPGEPPDVVGKLSRRMRVWLSAAITVPENLNSS